MSEEGLRVDDFLGGISIPFAQGHGDVALSAGYMVPSCDDGGCDGNFVAGVAVEGSVLRSHASNALYSVGLAGQFGFGKPSHGTLLSASIGVPVSVAIGKADGVHLVPLSRPPSGGVA